MGNRENTTVLRSVHTLFGVGTLGGMTDGQLLDQFLSRRDETAELAFEVLVLRHGPMVLDVCRNILGEIHEAQDTFQATFLILARKADTIRRRDSVASWLYGVARRVAIRAKSETTRRRTTERRAMMMSSQNHPSGGDREDHSVLHEEIDRLPEKYRNPIVLCYLEGMTHERAAEQLHCPVSTVGVRLMRAKSRLRSRLTRRGFALPAGLVAAGMTPRAASAALPTALVDSTVRAAMQSFLGKTAAVGLVSASVALLTEGVLRSMLMTRGKSAALALVSAGLVVTIGGLSLGRVSAHQRGGEVEAQAQADAPVIRREPRPPTPKEQYEELLKKYDASRSEYIRNEPRAKDASAGFLKLARENPDDPVAIDALRWVVTHTLFTPMAGEAMGLLTQDHLASDRLAPLVRELNSLYGGPFDPYEQMLRKVLKDAPQREARGWACLGLADSLKEKKEYMEGQQHAFELFQESPEGRPFMTKPEIKEGEIEGLMNESAKYYERAIKEFGDIKADERYGDFQGVAGTLGDAAESGLYALRHLSAGNVAPEIDGQDVEGKRFRLRDYRGKVVVLSFSGNWCGPCRGMYPEERELVARLQDEPFALVSVNTDEDRETLRKLIEDGEITWRCWWDGGIGPITKRWNVDGFPTVFVIDHEGVIRYKNSHDLRADVERLLREMRRRRERTSDPPK